MTIQNADEARALSCKNTWNLELVLAAIEGAAMKGERCVFLSGRLNNELRNELIVRGFKVEFKDSETEAEW